MYAIFKDFQKGPIAREDVYDILKNGCGKIMCQDTQYSFLEEGKIEAVHIGSTGELVSETIEFGYPTPHAMLHETEKGVCLPWGPWYHGSIIGMHPETGKGTYVIRDQGGRYLKEASEEVFVDDVDQARTFMGYVYASAVAGRINEKYVSEGDSNRVCACRVTVAKTVEI